MVTISEALTIAVRHHQAGNLQTAEQLYQQILAVDPHHAGAMHLLGVVAHQVGRSEVAVECIEQAIVLNPLDPAFHNNLGEAHRASRRTDTAIACYRRALELKPDFAEAHGNLGIALADQGKLDEAVACYRRALALRPDSAKVHNSLGNAFKCQGEPNEAVAYYRRALELAPDFPEAHNNLGVTLREQGKLGEALVCYRRALELRPDFAEAHNNLGAAWQEQGKLDEGIASYLLAIELKPEFVEAHNNLGNALRNQGKLDEAITCYRRVLQIKPDYWTALASLVHELQHMCCWEGLAEFSRRVIAIVDEHGDCGRDAPVSPFAFMALPTPTTAEQQLRCARQWAAGPLKTASESHHSLSPAQPARPKSRVTIGYLSADFHSHPTAWLIAELIEKHDRTRFAVFGYSYGPDDRSSMRHRLVKAFDRFVDLQNSSSAEAAQRIAADDVQILVDLKGYTTDARTQILALRPAPIQVNYLGYPGTMGAAFMDYILVDDYVVPLEQQRFFSERLVHLPGCYQVNDSQRAIAAGTPSRSECELPESGFVFCCFNNSYKITPDVFGVWMSLLKAVPESVLWLLEANRFVVANLRKEAALHGIPAARLVFAPRTTLPEHLARQRLADLFLDTFPVNAHTTASDALWAGCPVLTIAGETLASRVAASLLREIGLPELITTSLGEYQEMARRLARDTQQLAELRARLEDNRKTSGLFDGGRFARNIEKAYATMWETHAAGREPVAFRIRSGDDCVRGGDENWRPRRS